MDLRIPPSSCHDIHASNDGWFEQDEWWTSDPADLTDDLDSNLFPGNDDMMSDEGPRQPLDTRRMNYVFDVCAGAGC